MAKSLPSPTSTFFILLTILFSSTLTTAKSHRFSQRLSSSHSGLKREKLSHLHFYFHDIVSGPNPTAVRVAQAAATSTSHTAFGAVFMMDDPLTIGPHPGSKLVGRAQGTYASASKTELGLLMVLNFAFTEGKYNGSSLGVLGRNAVFSEDAVDLKTGDAVVEYNVYVLHY